MKLSKLSNLEIESLDYSSFVSLIDERNRCSGGIKSVHNVIVNSRINEKSNVLEIGCNTGFSSVNLSYLSGCNVIGIDINEESLKLARRYAKRNGLEKKVRFLLEDAEHLTFGDETFDLVWASNVTSFVKNKDSAISEYLRVLKFGGTLSIIPIYYKKNPPEDLVLKISKAIGNRIDVYTKDYWTALINNISKRLDIPLELYYSKTFEYEDSKDKIDDFINLILDKPHIKKMDNLQIESIRKRAQYFYGLFNENLKYCRYSIFLYQKRRESDEMELFSTRAVRND